MYQEVENAARWMDGFDKPWFIAGGWAIDLFIGKQTRQHADLEIGIFRKDQRALRNHLAEWEFLKAENGSLICWGEEFLELPIHEIHSVNGMMNQQLEVLLSEHEAENWIFRRNPAIKCAMDEVILVTDDGIPFLNPQIVLLFKLNARQKDHDDFHAANDFLTKTQRSWLKVAIQKMDTLHPWISFL